MRLLRLTMGNLRTEGFLPQIRSFIPQRAAGNAPLLALVPLKWCLLIALHVSAREPRHNLAEVFGSIQIEENPLIIHFDLLEPASTPVHNIP